MSPSGCLPSRSAALLLGLLALAGCRASYVDRGAALYAERNYLAAAEVFEHTEKRLGAASSDEKARYALYRGATLLSLGDAARAQHWLAYASRVLQRDPDALDEEEHHALTLAWRAHATLLARNQRTAQLQDSATTELAAAHGPP